MLELNRNCDLNDLENCLAFSFDVKCVDSNFHIKARNVKEKYPLYKGVSDLNIKNITYLDLSNCKLYELDDSLGMLPLKHLNISHNEFVEVPNCITQGLFHLEDLNMSHNQLKKFDKEPGCCCRLKKLDLSYNNITTLPKWIQTCNAMNLKELNYSCNIIGDTSKSEYKKVACYNLEQAIFRSTRFTGNNIPFIKSIRTLKYLDLSNKDYHSNTIFSLEKLFEKNDWNDTLTVLILSNLDISFLPDNISKLTNLKELSLKENNLYYLPDTIGDLKNLESLDISHNHLWCLPSTFSNLIELKILKINNNNLCRIEQIYKLQKLVILDLYHNELDSFDNNFKVDYIDLEQNTFDTANFNDYTAKKVMYRSQNKLLNRLDGPLIEEIFDHVESSSDKFSEDSFCNGNQSHEAVSLDSESWDDVKIKTHPDITSSDEEWDGNFRYPTPKKKPTSKFSPDCHELFKDCAEV